jgi:hypothetical protein
VSARRLALLSLAALLIGAALPVATASAADGGLLCQLLGIGCPPPDPGPGPNPGPPTTPTTPTTPTGSTTDATETTDTTTTGTQTVPTPPDDGRHCVPGVGKVENGKVGPIEIGDGAQRVVNHAGALPRHLEPGLIRYCVKGGGRIDVTFHAGRVAMAVTRAQGYRYKQLGPGDPVAGLRKGAKGAHKNKAAGFRIDHVLIGEDGGFVKYVAPVSHALLHDRNALKHHLRRAGV